VSDRDDLLRDVRQVAAEAGFTDPPPLVHVTGDWYAIDHDGAKAELLRLRAALDDPEQFGWSGPPTYAIAYAAAIRDVKAFLLRVRKS
jgi:hypothetical protein